MKSKDHSSHMFLWYRPGSGHPREIRLSSSMFKTVIIILSLFIALLLTGIGLYTTLVQKAIERNQLLQENEELRTEMLRIMELEEQLSELQDFAGMLQRSLTEGSDLQRILQARRSVQREIPPVQQAEMWIPVSGEDGGANGLLGMPLMNSDQTLVHLPEQWPVEGFLTRGYHYSPIDPSFSHTGIDIAVPRGTPVRATANGVVLVADWTPRLGYRIILDHGGGVFSVYGHNELLLVLPQQMVQSGTPIALTGSSGISTAPHLHFEVWVEDRSIDPQILLPSLGDEDGVTEAG